MTSWETRDSLYTIAPRQDAWAYWSDMQNHAAMEAVRIELDGPFQTGTKGRTIAEDMRQEWELREVIDLRRFVITGRDSEFELSFAWDFEDEDSGTRMTQTISATGSAEQMQNWAEALQQMKLNAPVGIKKLTEKLDRLVAP